MIDNPNTLPFDAIIRSKAADVLTSEPLTVSLPLKNPNALDRLLIALKIKPKEIKFIIKPLLVGTRYRIASIVTRIPDDILGSDGIKADAILKALMNSDYAHNLICVAALGIQNNAEQPKESLLGLIKKQMTDSEVAILLDAIFTQIPIKDFIKSTISIKGADILKSA